MQIITEIFSMFFGLIKEMYKAFMEVAPKLFSFTLWVLAALFILPCVFVASQLYPKWAEWGQEF